MDPTDSRARFQELRLEYAGVGWRFLAVLIDSVVIFMLFVGVIGAAAAGGAIDVERYAAGGLDLQQTLPLWLYIAAYSLLFGYYAITEGLWGGSPGKLALGMRVLMDDGSRRTGTAIVVRNLVRIPEAIFYYIPSGVSCAANPKRKRLGDFAARTVVVRLAPARVTTAAPRGPGPAVVPPAPGAPAPDPGGHAGWPAAPAPAAAEPDAAAALAALKQAALTVRGAHHSYLRRSEAELTTGGAETGDYSPEYVAAWYTLADAVKTLQRVYSEAIAAATREGTTVADLAAPQPDLQYLFAELQPYFTAGSDERVHEAYLEVARSEVR